MKIKLKCLLPVVVFAFVAVHDAAAATFIYSGTCTDCALLDPVRPFEEGQPLVITLDIADAAVTPGATLDIGDLEGFLVSAPLADGTLNIFGIQGFTTPDFEPGSSFAATLDAEADGFVDDTVSVDVSIFVAELEFFQLTTDAAGNFAVVTRVFTGEGTGGPWTRAVPEPASAVLLLAGVIGLAGVRAIGAPTPRRLPPRSRT